MKSVPSIKLNPNRFNLGVCLLLMVCLSMFQSIDSAYINANAYIDRMVEVKMIHRAPQELPR